MRFIRDSGVFWICIALFSCFWTSSIRGSLTRNCSQGFQGAFCDGIKNYKYRMVHRDRRYLY